MGTRKVISALSAVLAAAVAGSGMAGAAFYQPGDINGDDFIDATDATLILSAYAALSTEQLTGLSSAQLAAADVNGDGLIDATDATTVLGYYAYTSTGGTCTFDAYVNGNTFSIPYTEEIETYSGTKSGSYLRDYEYDIDGDGTDEKIVKYTFGAYDDMIYPHFYCIYDNAELIKKIYPDNMGGGGNADLHIVLDNSTGRYHLANFFNRNTIAGESYILKDVISLDELMTCSITAGGADRNAKTVTAAVGGSPADLVTAARYAQGIQIIDGDDKAYDTEMLHEWGIKRYYSEENAHCPDTYTYSSYDTEKGSLVRCHRYDIDNDGEVEVFGEYRIPQSTTGRFFLVCGDGMLRAISNETYKEKGYYNGAVPEITLVRDNNSGRTHIALAENARNGYFLTDFLTNEEIVSFGMQYDYSTDDYVYRGCISGREATMDEVAEYCKNITAPEGTEFVFDTFEDYVNSYYAWFGD